MDGSIRVSEGLYSWRKDRDKAGVYYWILDPSGKELIYVDTRAFADVIVQHLNRGKRGSKAHKDP